MKKMLILSLGRHLMLDIPLSGSPYGCAPAIDGDTVIWLTGLYDKAKGMSFKITYSIADGPVENLTTGNKYDYIQHAIIAAEPGNEIMVKPRVYHESIDFKGKDLTLRSIDPYDRDIAAVTVIKGNSSKGVVSFVNKEKQKSILSGFTITGGSHGIYGEGLVYSTITNCDIVKNNGNGILLSGYGNFLVNNCRISENGKSGVNDGCGSILTNCIVSRNKESGIIGKIEKIANCTITGNGQLGVLANILTITNSILRDNKINQIASYPQSTFNASVMYTNMQGGWQGIGNIDADPCFVTPGYWDINDTPADSNDDFWIDGDYNLLNNSPCINAGDPNYIASPNKTDFDGKPRIIAGRIDMGACEFNHLPVADAGEDLTAYAWIDGFAEIILDGSGSYDDDNQPLSYRWAWSADGNSFTSCGDGIINFLDLAAIDIKNPKDGSPISDLSILCQNWLNTSASLNWDPEYDLAPGTGQILRTRLSAGQYVFALIVNDGIVDSAPDDVNVTVLPAIKVEMNFTPQTLDSKSNGQWVKAHFTLSPGILPGEVNVNIPAVVESMNIKSQSVRVFTNERGNTVAEVSFDRQAFCENVTDNSDLEVTVVGSLTTGQYFYGSDTIRIRYR